MQKQKVVSIGLDTGALQAFLRAAANVTGLHVVALDTRGTPLWKDEELFECPLCRARVRRGRSPCRRRTQEAARTAVAGRVIHTYRCHDDIVGIAVPLFGKSSVVACLCAGPALRHPLSRRKAQRLVEAHTRTTTNRHALCQSLATLPVIPEAKMHALAQLLTGAGHFTLRSEPPLQREVAEMRLVIDLVRGNVRTEEEARMRLAYVGLGQHFTPAVVLVADIDDFAKRTKGLPQAACTLIKESVLCAIRAAVGESLSAVISGDSTVVILGQTSSDTPVRSKPRREALVRWGMKCAEQARRAVRRQTGMTVTMGVGRPHVGPLEVHKSYLEAQRAVAYKRLLGKNRAIFIGTVEPGESPHDSCFRRPCQRLLMALRAGAREEVQARLHLLFADYAESSESDVGRLKNFALHIVTRAAEVAVERGLSQRVTAIVPFEFSRAIEDLTAPADIETALAEQILSLADSIAGVSARWATERVEIARRYIDVHLASPLTLERVCREAVHLSPSHFTRVFKKQTGESFVQYLNRTRVERARDLLLNSDMTVNEVSASVGYSSQHYFCRVFHRIMGISPNQFRRQRAQTQAATGKHS